MSATLEAPSRGKVAKAEEEDEAPAVDGVDDDGGSDGDGSREKSNNNQPEVIVVDSASDEPITMPSLCMNCYENVS